MCETCSSNKLVLNNGSANQGPQRVCDNCHEMLTKKKESISETYNKQQRHFDLLMESSVNLSSAVGVPASESLIDIFYLDGSYKTLCYDESTTAEDLSSRLYTSKELHNVKGGTQFSSTSSNVFVAAALFEVLQDLNDPKQYKIIKQNENIAEIVQRWTMSKLKYVKLVVPLYEISSSSVADASYIIASQGVLSATKRSFPTNRGSNPSNVRASTSTSIDSNVTFTPTKRAESPFQSPSSSSSSPSSSSSSSSTPMQHHSLAHSPGMGIATVTTIDTIGAHVSTNEANLPSSGSGLGPFETPNRTQGSRQAEGSSIIIEGSSSYSSGGYSSSSMAIQSETIHGLQREISRLRSLLEERDGRIETMRSVAVKTHLIDRGQREREIEKERERGREKGRERGESSSSVQSTSSSSNSSLSSFDAVMQAVSIGGIGGSIEGIGDIGDIGVSYNSDGDADNDIDDDAIKKGGAYGKAARGASNQASSTSRRR